MKLKKFPVFVLALVAVGCSTFSGGGGRSPASLAGEFKPPAFEQMRLKNGLEVLLIKDDSLPYLSLALALKSGNASDPKGKSGLADLVASLLDKGTSVRTKEGIKKKNAIQIADGFGKIAANFSVNVEPDYTLATAGTLAAYQDELLENFAEVITQPTFSEDEMVKAIKKQLSQAQQIIDQPAAFSAELLPGLLYGPNHPYGGSLLESRKDLRKVKRKDVNRFYITNYRPSNAYLAVVGKFDDSVKANVEKAFGDWADRKKEPSVIPSFPKLEGRKVLLVGNPTLNQSQIYIAGAGVERKNPDYLALRVANIVLAGGFGSRLMEEVRVKRGLTYSISSQFEWRLGEGPFLISTFSRNEKVGETLQVSLATFQEFVKKGVTEKEVKDAKAQLSGNFARSLETGEKLAQNLLLLRIYGVSDTYLDNFYRDLDKLSVSQINEAIKKHLSPDNLRILVYGNPKVVESQLKAIAPLEVKKSTDFL